MIYFINVSLDLSDINRYGAQTSKAINDLAISLPVSASNTGTSGTTYDTAYASMMINSVLNKAIPAYHLGNAERLVKKRNAEYTEANTTNELVIISPANNKPQNGI